MDLKTRISAFAELGTRLPGLVTGSLHEQVCQINNWFTQSETERALRSWSELLSTENLIRWTDPYPINQVISARNILVITAVNIPLVGFHDFLSVLISGNRFIGRLSSRDDLLLITLANELTRIEPHFSKLIQLNEYSGTPDAVIATGSNNSSRYFQAEYGHLPHIIRKNRSSAAVLDGTESDEDLSELSGDILQYYGLGCRSISHLFLPGGYSPESLTKPLSFYREISPCAPFSNNHRFQKARLSMLTVPFLEAGPVLLVENESLHSPIGVVQYSFYDDRRILSGELKSHSYELQCICGKKSGSINLIPFGTAQKPDLWDYADQADIMKFLINI